MATGTNDTTIITFADISKVRPIAQNIQSDERVQPCIVEAERLDILPAIGASLYRQLANADREEEVIIIGGISLTKSEFMEILDGGYYTDCCDNTEQYQGGLIAAISYLTYARLILQNNINVTAFGVVAKINPETSEPTGDQIIIRASNQAKQTGLEILRQCLEFLKCKKLLPCRTGSLDYKFGFKVIGD